MSIIFGTTGFAQADASTKISDEEFEDFVSAFEEVQALNQEGQEKMVAAIQEEGLDIQRFNDIQQAQHNPDAEVEATAEELESYEKVAGELAEIQGEIQKEMMGKIESAGITIQRYQEIATALQTDPALQEKFKEHLQN